MSRSGDVRKLGIGLLLGSSPVTPRKRGSRAAGEFIPWIPASAGMTGGSLLAGFHRQVRVVRPFRHRCVVKLDVGVAQHRKHEGVGTGRDAAAAIGDDLLLV